MIKYSRIAVVLLCVLLFFFLMHEVQREKALAFDTYITELFSVGENTFSFTFFKSITYLGKSKFIGFGSILCVLYLWIIKKDYWTMAVFSIGMAEGDVLNGWIKNHIKRVRPENHLHGDRWLQFSKWPRNVGPYFLQYGCLFNHKRS